MAVVRFLPPVHSVQASSRDFPSRYESGKAMDPYKNWGNDLDSSDSYYPSSSRDKPVRRSSKDLGTGKRSSVSSLGGADVYDFDIDGDSDEFNSSPDTKTSTFRSSRESASGKRSSTSDVFKMTSTATSFNYESNKYTMRKSTDERMKEILESNKKAAAESSKVCNHALISVLV